MNWLVVFFLFSSIKLTDNLFDCSVERGELVFLVVFVFMFRQKAKNVNLKWKKNEQNLLIREYLFWIIIARCTHLLSVGIHILHVFFLLSHTQITYKIKKMRTHTHSELLSISRTFILLFFLCVFKGNSVERKHLKRKSTPPNRTFSPQFIFCLNLWNLKICENVCWISIEIPFLWCQSKTSVKPA